LLNREDEPPPRAALEFDTGPSESMLVLTQPKEGLEFHSNGQSLCMVLTFDPMHDEQWTRRAVMGHESQLGKLEMVIAAK
jgi:hypothetical protein